MSPARIPHATHCSRPAPLLRLSWAGTPEAWCPSCGRATPAPDTRTRSLATDEPEAGSLVAIASETPESISSLSPERYA